MVDRRALAEAFGQYAWITLDGDTAAFMSNAQTLIFERASGVWTETATLQVTGILELDGDTLLIGRSSTTGSAPLSGVVSSYVRTGSTWSLEETFFPADSSPFSLFGDSIDLDGDRAIIGAPVTVNSGGGAQGAAYVFERVGSSWHQTHKFMQDPLPPTGMFGRGVSIDGDVCAIKVSGSSIDVDVYRQSGGTWSREAVLQSPSGSGGFGNGKSVVVNDNLVMVGDHNAFGDEGRAYIYADNAGAWDLVATVVPVDPMPGAFFGASLDLSNRIFAVGAPRHDGFGLRSGSAYLYEHCGGIGDLYCVANPNSTGQPARICAAGSLDLAQEDLRIVGTHLPTTQFGYYLMSESMFFLPNFGGSAGNLCIGPPQYRFIHDILNSGSSGTMSYDVDMQNLPQNQVFTSGSTWHFQLWYRDGATSNTTPGLTFVWD